jgi:hypothetical protein
MPEPTHEERAGERTYNETPTGVSRNEKYRRAAVRASGDIKDSVENMHSIVQAGVNPVRPTGQHVAAPHGDYHAPEASAGASPDPVVGAVAGAAMLAEAVRVLRERRRARRRRNQDANG